MASYLSDTNDAIINVLCMVLYFWVKLVKRLNIINPEIIGEVSALPTFKHKIPMTQNKHGPC